MRISGGEWRGRVIKTPPGGNVRPTQDCVREALFSILANDIAGANFLDLFAGSGSVGLEALSRGAARAAWVEKDPRNVALIKQNQAILGASGSVMLAEVERWLASGGRDFAADIAYCDPPYELARAQGFSRFMELAATSNAIRVGGVFIAEMARDANPGSAVGWTSVRDRAYGRTRIAIFRRD